MKRPGGFTLLELMAVTSVLGVATIAYGAIAEAVHREERASAERVADLDLLRRLSRRLEDDLRSGEDVAWTLQKPFLWRGADRVASNASALEILRVGDLATARLSLRARTPGRSDPEVRIEVRTRVPGRPR